MSPLTTMFRNGSSLDLGRPIPFFMQMATQYLHRLWKREQRKIVAGDVDTVFDAMVVGSAARTRLQHFHSRIRQYYADPKGSIAYALLGQISVSDSGLRRATLLQETERLLADLGVALPAHERQAEIQPANARPRERLLHRRERGGVLRLRQRRPEIVVEEIPCLSRALNSNIGLYLSGVTSPERIRHTSVAREHLLDKRHRIPAWFGGQEVEEPPAVHRSARDRQNSPALVH